MYRGLYFKATIEYKIHSTVITWSLTLFQFWLSSAWNLPATLSLTSMFQWIAISTLLTRKACHFAELTSGSGWRLSEQREWAGYLLCRPTSSLPPQLHKSSDESFQHCLNSHTITFSCSSSSLDSLHQSVFFFFFLCWAHEICSSFFRRLQWHCSVSKLSPCPLCFSHTLTLTFFAKCGGGGSNKGKPHPLVFCTNSGVYMNICTCLNVRGCLRCLPLHVFNNLTTCFSCLLPGIRDKFVLELGHMDGDNLVWLKTIELALCFCVCKFTGNQLDICLLSLMLGMLVNRWFGHLDVHTVNHC